MTNQSKQNELVLLNVLPGLLGVIVVIFVLSSLFVVKEGEQAMVQRLGDLRRDSDDAIVVYKPGIHFKLPMIENVILLSSRLQTFQTPTLSILTTEQKFVNVDYFVKWRITDYEKFYLRTSNNILTAENLLEKKVSDALRTAFAKQTIQEIIAGERANIMADVVDRVKETSNYLGISVIDVRIKKIDLPEEVNLSVFERMRVERKKVANAYRSNGQKESEKLRANADKEVILIEARAVENAARIKAEGEQTSAKILNETYAQDPEFYSFLRSLDAYTEVFDENDILVVNPEDNSFFDVFSQSRRSESG